MDINEQNNYHNNIDQYTFNTVRLYWQRNGLGLFCNNEIIRRDAVGISFVVSGKLVCVMSFLRNRFLQIDKNACVTTKNVDGVLWNSGKR